MSGRFITLEGGEGSGKTTQIQLLHAVYKEAGHACVVTREPGGGAGADAIRQLLLTGVEDKWHKVSETLLFQAARVEHVEHVIKPALHRGDTVLCDRFLDSTIVYQGISKGLGADYVRALHQLTLGNVQPDVTLILDIDPAVGLTRAKARAGDETRFENMGTGFHSQVREGFLSLARIEPERCKVIDASQSAEEVHKAIRKAVGL